MACRAKTGFTLIEILIVVVIIATLATVTIVSLNIPARFQQTKINAAMADASALKAATQLYFADMGFYPPDVNRGVDPGFTQPLPNRPDGSSGDMGIICYNCPANWQTIVAQKWRGPYLVTWPASTPWGGKYDYNYWRDGQTRYGCVVPPGIYAGIQGDYDNNNTVPQSAEQEMTSRGYDADGCVNGEVELILIKF